MLVDAVCFLFQPNNLQLLSWHTERLPQQNGTIVDFPSIKRQRCRVHTSSDYDEKHKAHPFLVLGRSMFTKTLTALTQGEQHRTNSVDYVIGVLRYDNVVTLVSTVQN